MPNSQPEATPPPMPSPSAFGGDDDLEVIVISSDSDDVPLRKVQRRTRKRQRQHSRTPHRHPLQEQTEVIELLDSDDEPPVPRRRKTPAASKPEVKDKKTSHVSVL